MSVRAALVSCCLALAGCASALPDDPPAACATPAVTLPILSTDGAVLVPVEIDGHPAAAEITPRASITTLTDRTGLHPHGAHPVALGSLTGGGLGWYTYLREIRLGALRIENPHVVFRQGPPRPPVDGRPIMLTIGTDLLARSQLLIDLPDRRLTLSGTPSCHGPDLPFPGSVPPAAVALRQGADGQIDLVDAVIDGYPVPMEINLSSNDSLLTADTAAAIGVPAAVLAADPRVRTAGPRGRVGRRHRFRSLRLGSYVLADPRFDLQPDIDYDLLGLDFFQNKTVLFDFPGRRMLFRVSGTAAPSRRARFSAVDTRNADAAVTETGPAR